MIEIDGSILEGGGQILRMSLACSALTGSPIRVYKIRAGRKKGGLAAQHLKGFELMRDICQAKVKGAFLGSSEIEFIPGHINGGHYVADTKTAGSVALLLQVALPAILFANAPTTLELRGGTNAEMAPQIDFISRIFKPNLEKFGAVFEMNVLKRGYFPKGGGIVRIEVNPVSKLYAVDITEFGEVEKFFVYSYSAGKLPITIAEELYNGSVSEIENLRVHKKIQKEVIKEDAKDNSAGTVVGCVTTTGCILGGSALSQKKESTFDTGCRAAKELTNAVRLRSCTDEYIQDQLIVFMALAVGTSRMRTTFPLTLHTTTAIHIVGLITQANFEVIEEGNTCIIQCNGRKLEL